MLDEPFARADFVGAFTRKQRVVGPEPADVVDAGSADQLSALEWAGGIAACRSAAAGAPPVIAA